MGARYSAAVCDLRVFVDHSTEAVAADDLAFGAVWISMTSRWQLLSDSWAVAGERLPPEPAVT
ncbi:hypothetical protein GCM10009753_44370 [Streptantibioticus ferralitis]